MKNLLLLSVCVTVVVSCNYREDVARKYPKCDVILIPHTSNSYLVKDTARHELRFVRTSDFSDKIYDNFVIVKIAQ